MTRISEHLPREEQWQWHCHCSSGEVNGLGIVPQVTRFGVLHLDCRLYPFLNFRIICLRDDIVRCFHTDPITYPISGIYGEGKHRISCYVGYDRDVRHTWQFRFCGMKHRLINLSTVVIDTTLDGMLLACNSVKNALDWYQLPHSLCKVGSCPDPVLSWYAHTVICITVIHTIFWPD